MDNYEENKAMTTDALGYIPADDYDIYKNVVAALKHEALTGKIAEPEAEDMARTWAQKSIKFDPKEFAAKWKSFKDAYGGDLIGAGSIIKMAKDYGYKPTGPQAVAFDVGSTIDLSDLAETNTGHSMNELPQYPLSESEQERQILQFLDLYKDEEKVNIVISAERSGDKWIPSGKGVTRTAREWKISIHAGFVSGKGPFPDVNCEMDEVTGKIRSYNPEAGVWVRINPTDGQGVADNNITAYRYALIESDNMSKEQQLRLIKKIGAVMLAVDSGHKSVHAVINLDAYNLLDYRKKVNELHDICSQIGLIADPNTKNPSRLMRLPGIQRENNFQRIVYAPKDPMTFDAWKAFLTMGLPEDISSDWETFDPGKELAPQLIQGILRCGHKMLIAGPSKAGKSFALLELAAAITTGGRWLGHQCTKGRVLYINFEIDSASSKNRIHKVFTSMGHPEGPGADMFDVWNLRGKLIIPDAFIDNVIRYAKKKHYSAVIIDPVYKLMTGTDENSAGDIGSLVVKFDRICTATGAAVIIAHHFSKGSAYGKSFQNVADRASGSGVFGRDPDAIATLMQLVYDPTTYGRQETVTAWRVSFSLREFPPPKDTDCFFDYPVHYLDNDGLLRDAPFVGNPGVNGGKKLAAIRTNQVETRLDSVLRVLGEQLDENNTGKISIVRRFKNVGDRLSISVDEVARLAGIEQISGATMRVWLENSNFVCSNSNKIPYVYKR